MLYFADGSWVPTSLCPTLGKMYAELHVGVCPSHLQSPFGKTLNISFIGLPPYVNYNPIGGSEFVVTQLLAKKFRFIPKFIPAKSWDTYRQDNKTIYGMVHQVRVVHTALFISSVARFLKMRIWGIPPAGGQLL